MTRPSVGVNLTWCVPGGAGGSEQYLVRQVLGLVEIGAPYDLTVYAPRGFSAAHTDVAAAVHVVEAPSDGRSRALRVALESAWLAPRTRRHRLVHHGGGTLPSVAPGATLLTVHDVQYLDYPEYFGAVKLRWLRSRVPESLRRATAVAVPSEFVRGTLSRVDGGPRGPVHVVRHGVEPRLGGSPTPAAELRRRFGLGDAPVVVYPAVTHPHKNHAFLLDLLAGPWRDVVLVLAGSAGRAEGEVAARAAALGVADRVRRTGRVGDDDRDGLLLMADALVFPSRYEGFGAPLIEAMALGVPVVASDCAAVPGVVGDAGLVLPLRTESWAGALGEVRARRDDLVARGRRRAAEFTSRASAEDLVVAYESALGART